MIRIRIQKFIHKNTTGIWIMDDRLDEHVTYIAQPVQLRFEKAPDEFLLPDPTLEMEDMIAAQFFPALADGMEEAGIGELRHKQQEKELAATRAHLSDLRKIVFNELGIHGN